MEEDNQKKKRGRPSHQQLLVEEQANNLKNPKRKCLTSFFKPTSGKRIEKPVCTPQVYDTNIALSSTSESVEERSQILATMEVLSKENRNLKFEVMHLKESNQNQIESLQNEIVHLSNQIELIKDSEQVKYLKQELEKEKTQMKNILKHDLVKELLVALSTKNGTLNDMRKSIISSMLKNTSTNAKTYTVLERDFWLDVYHNCSHRVFNRISEVLNGPWRSTVQKWGGKTEKNTYNLSWRTVERCCRFIGEEKSTMKIPEFDPILESEKIPWSNSLKKLEDIQCIANCMIDETALKPSIQFSQVDKCVYGYSAMPRFVVIRNIDVNFDIADFFHELKIQSDTKTNKPVCGILQSESFCIGYAQFASYKDWIKALSMSCNEMVIEIIESIPQINDADYKENIDMVFFEAELLKRPTSTYVYSMVISNCVKRLPVQEVAIISTNNRYLQHQDHQFLAHNVMKMLNFYGIPLLQFVADGDTRFRRQMLLMAGYIPKEVRTTSDFAAISGCLVHESKSFGWEVRRPTNFQVCHYIRKSDEMIRSNECKYLASKPKSTFSQDDNVTISFYLTVAFLKDVFTMSAPFIGGLPRIVTQDQLHWLRKLVKSSTLSCKPLRVGDYVVMFQAVCDVYEMGANFGLLKRDIDINNKTEQGSAERLISNECLDAMNSLHWAKGTKFLLYLGKVGFDAWWRDDLNTIERISYCYYVCKVIHLWNRWIKSSKLSMKSCFITLELFRDTLVMCSSMVHFALTFKLFHPKLPFIPWKWSEYPVESYYSSVRSLFGNDDEFTAMEYLQRSAKLVSRQKIDINGNISNRRNIVKASRWNHPKNPTKESHPNLFDHEWSLIDLLNHLVVVDRCIIADFKVLGMDTLLRQEPLYKVKSAKERLENEWDYWDYGQPSNRKYTFVRCFESIDPPAAVQKTQDSRNIRKHPTVIVNGRAITVAKYVSVYKQKGGASTTGQRNTKRFWRKDDNDDENVLDVAIKAGDFFFSKTYGVVEILQLCRKKTFVHSVADLTNINFIGIPYLRVNDTNVHYARPTFTRKYYSALSDMFLEKIHVTETWHEGNDKYVKIGSAYPKGVVPQDNVDDEEGDCERYCFCREPGWLGGKFIQCEKPDCKISWYHLDCVKLTKAPKNAWTCPRCANKDHWCICGGKESICDMVECSRQELCAIRWFHLTCVKMKVVPAGEWLCDFCVDDICDNTISMCFCDQKINLDSIVKCQNPLCEIRIFHKCCVGINAEEADNWTCEVCS